MGICPHGARAGRMMNRHRRRPDPVFDLGIQFDLWAGNRFVTAISVQRFSRQEIPREVDTLAYRPKILPFGQETAMDANLIQRVCGPQANLTPAFGVQQIDPYATAVRQRLPDARKPEAGKRLDQRC